MPHFRVETNITYNIPYLVEAETESEAEQIAKDRAQDGMGLENADIVDVEILDIWDESEEHE
jgi:hypothetical protein